jgi:hypothetical protein
MKNLCIQRNSVTIASCPIEDALYVLLLVLLAKARIEHDETPDEITVNLPA